MSAGVAAFFAEHLFVHTHIESTGGSALASYLKTAFGAARVLEVPPDGASQADPAAMDDAARSEIYALSGHFPAHSLERRFARRHLRIALVGDPVARMVSFYNDLLDAPDHPDDSRFARLPFDEAVGAMIEARFGPVHNQQSRQIGGKEGPNWLGLAYAVERDYAVVCSQASVDRLCAMIGARFGLPAGAQHTNRDRREPFEVAPVTAARLRETNALDQRLYNYVLRHENRLLERFDAFLEAMLRAIDPVAAVATSDTAIGGTQPPRQQHRLA